MAKKKKDPLSQRDIGMFVRDTIANLKSADPKKITEVVDTAAVEVLRWGRFVVNQPRFPVVATISNEKRAFLALSDIKPVEVEESDCNELARAIRSYVLTNRAEAAMEWDETLEEVYG